VAFANSNIAVDGLVTNAPATGYTQGRTGTLGLNAYSGGGYWTHYGPTVGISTQSCKALTTTAMR
jgi:hypothetical protein